MEKEDKDDNEDKNEESGKKEKLPRIEITELFMAKCGEKGWDRCFWGTINREKDETGREISCSSRIDFPDDGCIWSRAEDQHKLGSLLDAIVEWRLVHRLHRDMGKFSQVAEARFFHN